MFVVIAVVMVKLVTNVMVVIVRKNQTTESKIVKKEIIVRTKI